MDHQQTFALGEAFAAALHAVERRDEGAIARMLEHFSPEARLSNAALKQAGEERRGLEKIRAFWEAYQHTFRVVHTEFFAVTSGERSAGLFWTTRGVDVRGGRVEYDGATLLVFDEGGKITRLRGYYDTREITRTVGQ